MSTSQINETLLDGPFEGASLFSRSMRNWIASQGSADADLLSSLPILRARCRDAYRNIDIAQAPIDRVVQHTVGSGLKLQITLDRERLGYISALVDRIEKDIEDQFNKWSINCDYDRHQNFGGLQELVLTSMLASGDVFVNTFIDDTLLIRVIEGDQVTNPNFAPDIGKYRGGVELDDLQRPTAYHVLEKHPGDLYTSWKWNRIPLFGEKTNLQRFFHIMKNKRPGEHRGVPFLGSVLKTFRILEQYTKSELTAAAISAAFTVFIKKTSSGLRSEENELTGKREVTIGPGLVLELDSDEDVVFANPQRPNSSFDPFFTKILQKMGAGLGLPIEFILQSYNASYSASRAAMEQAWTTIMIYRNLVIDQFCNPMFNLWLQYAEIPQEIIDCIKPKWVGPARPSIDEYKAVLAAKERIQLGLSSRAEECEELRGVDWLEVNRQLAKEERQRQLDGLPSLVQTESIKDFLKDEEDVTTNKQSTNQ